ncbi:unnamed protein product [Cuscuta campestris]|uniref:Uncharacterized protein n=1 Tax=Cuscuta campestris TaxID=132261 RepID=A0A484LNV1_9ASTE|nr:unnamed protein product [Cuscuta campestris]
MLVQSSAAITSSFLYVDDDDENVAPRNLQTQKSASTGSANNPDATPSSAQRETPSSSPRQPLPLIRPVKRARCWSAWKAQEYNESQDVRAGRLDHRPDFVITFKNFIYVI